MRWEPSDKRASRLTAFIGLMTIAAGCGPREATVSQPEPQPAAASRQVAYADASSIYERPLRHIKQARFIKPPDAGDGEPELHLALAPIIVQEVIGTDEAAGRRDRFGAVRTKPGGTEEIDTAEPTVYWAEVTKMIAGKLRTQFIYAWAYETSEPGQSWGPNVLAIRVTLDATGMPAIYEVFDVEKGAKRIFVSQRLENLALAAHGGPLPGRRHAIESTWRDWHLEAFVPRVLADGPMPMGPLVYVESRWREISTLLCRCSSSQAEEFVETSNYQLQHLAELHGYFDVDDPPFITIFPRHCGLTIYPLLNSVEELEIALRLPPEW